MTLFNFDRRFLSCVAAATMLAACSPKDNTADQSREIQLAPAPTTQPALNDAAPRNAPAPTKAPIARPTPTPLPGPTRVRPAPVPVPTPVPNRGTIAAGSVLSVAPTTRICTNTHKVGDRFTASIQQSVQGTNGAMIPAGSTASMRVTESSRSENSKSNIKLAFVIESIQIGSDNYPVSGNVTQMAAMDKVRAQSTTTQAEKIGAGAAIGAIAGQILGKNTKSTVIGATVGAAAGTAVAAGQADYDGCVPVGTPMNVSLDQSVRVKL